MDMKNGKKIVLIGLVSILLLNLGVFIGQAKISKPITPIATIRPVAAFSWNLLGYYVSPWGNGSLFEFDPSNSSSACGIRSYSWDWTSDGIYDYTSTNSSVVEHYYTDLDSHKVTLKVTDNFGLTDIVTHIVFVF
jgi:hypothetical protein